MTLISSLFFFLLSGYSFVFQNNDQNLNLADLESLKKMMTGNFDSKEQATLDTNYFEIHSDGFWLYVEQAMVSMQDKPYRQRVYHVHLIGDNSIASEVFELKNPLRFTGSWKTENPLTTLNPDSLVNRTGCAITLKKQYDGSFKGKTNAKDCGSNLRGAKYATSEVVITPKLLLSWDRGFDENDKQVWGAEKGGYQFVKR
jgi:hypothetical protein